MVNDRQTLYDGLRHNQHFVPKMSEAIMTTVFMKGCVGSSQYWLPKCSEIRLLNCVDCPSRLDLAKMVHARMLVVNMGVPREPFDSSFRRTADEIVRKPPN